MAGVPEPIPSEHLKWLGGVLGLYSLAAPPDPDRLAGALPSLRLLRFKAGDPIIQEGEAGRGLFILRSGEASVCRGKSHVADLQPGALVGEIGLVTGSLRTATVQATRDCEVFSLPDVQAFLERYPSLRQFLSETAQHRMLELSRLSDFPRAATLPAVPGGAAPPKALLAGRYAMEAMIGQGGMGDVYRGFDRSLERKVAVKRVRAEYSQDPMVRERFLSEARVAARLSHPYIVAVYDIIEDGGELFLVMEFVDGSPLSDLVEKGRRFTLVDCQTLFSFVCQAVACAHWNHVLHRDIKPGNIMLDRMGFAKVMDFGLARRGGGGPREIVGTPTYMSLEQHRGDAGPASDVFGLGVCLYELLTGKLPFRGPDFLAEKKAGLAVLPSSVEPALKATGVDELLASALAPDPSKRPAGALPFLEALKGLPKR